MGMIGLQWYGDCNCCCEGVIVVDVLNVLNVFNVFNVIAKVTATISHPVPMWVCSQ